MRSHAERGNEGKEGKWDEPDLLAGYAKMGPVGLF
jgi:hypothetical protein